MLWTSSTATRSPPGSGGADRAESGRLVIDDHQFAHFRCVQLIALEITGCVASRDPKAILTIRKNRGIEAVVVLFEIVSHGQPTVGIVFAPKRERIAELVFVGV